METMRFVVIVAGMGAVISCGPLSRVQDAELADGRTLQTLAPSPITLENPTADKNAPVVSAKETPAPASNPDATAPAEEQSSAPDTNKAEPTNANDAEPTDANKVEPTDASKAEPQAEEFEIEERLGPAERFSDQALVFYLDEFGKDKKRAFDLSEDFTPPDWVSGLGFLFSDKPHPARYETRETFQPFRGWGVHAAMRLFQYQKEKSTVFRMTLVSSEIAIAKDKKEKNDKEKDKKPQEAVPARSRLILELAIKNGRPLLQLQTKVAGKKPRNFRVKGKARLPANQELNLVASLKGSSLRLYSGTYLIGETAAEPLDEKWSQGELVIGASHDHGKAPFLGFLRELEFADSLPLEYQ